MLLFRKRPSIGIGFDIGASGLKIAITEKENEDYIVRDIIVAELPEGCIDKGEIKEPDVLIDILRDVKRSLPKGEVSVVLSPSKSAIVSFTTNTTNNLKEQVEEEIKKRIPFFTNIEISMDYTFKEVDKSKFVVTVVVGKKDKVDEIVELFDTAGIEVSSVTSSYVATANAAILCYPEISEHSGAVVVDFGYHITSCVCVKAGAIIHGGYSETGIMHLEEKIAKGLSLPREEVKGRLTSSDIDIYSLNSFVIEFLTSFVPEIEGYISMCLSDTSVECNKSLFLGCGGAIDIAPLWEHLRTAFSLAGPMEILDISGRLKIYHEALKKLQSVGTGRLIPAIGASLV